MEFSFDEDKLIKEVIEQVAKLKDYHLSNQHGMKEHIGEYSHFSGISIDGSMLESYSFGKDSDGEYYLILWYTLPIYSMVLVNTFFGMERNIMENDLENLTKPMR